MLWFALFIHDTNDEGLIAAKNLSQLQIAQQYKLSFGATQGSNPSVGKNIPSKKEWDQTE